MSGDDRNRLASDLQTLRALTHPTRIALIETLAVHGPMTATEAAEFVGESPSSCSFHLRQLERYGFVEEAGGGRGRARPWRLAYRSLTIAGGEGDPEVEVAAGALGRLVRDRRLQRLQTWLKTRGSYPREWQSAAQETEALAWLTPAELTELAERLREVVNDARYQPRIEDPSARPAGALPVEMLVFGYPIAPRGRA
ncbi:MAG TPA: helix-turn-helix domain-containing protein [Solirubrobacteraceae bacterium]|nr:helix-turn-helix domain-containing protein [Solirubrobacteraceae bacterium]